MVFMVYRSASLNHSGHTYQYKKPNFCPYCGFGINADASVFSIGNLYWTGFFTCTLESCKKLFFCVYLQQGYELVPIFNHPREIALSVPVELSSLSNRFTSLYMQAYDAEAAGNYDLAACGYRNAVEALLKDFAVKYKSIEPDEALMRKSLQDCIAAYLDGLDESIAAYMVKEFGNAATHWPQVGRAFDFSEQKSYLEAFLQYMTGKIKILNVAAGLPPRYLQEFQKPAK